MFTLGIVAAIALSFLLIVSSIRVIANKNAMFLIDMVITFFGLLFVILFLAGVK